MTGSKRAARAMAALAGSTFAASLLLIAWSYAIRFGRIDESADSSLAALSTNLLLFAVFAAHHSIFARTPVKAWVSSLVPPDTVRATYVLIASVLFGALGLLWRPIAGTVWEVHGAGVWLLYGTQLAGLVIAVGAGRAFDVLELAGIRQVMPTPARTRDRLVDRGVYALVRHPLYLGILLMLWPMATMTMTRFVFAALTTAYVVLAIPFEERDLRKAWGTEYDRYAGRVRSRLIPFVY